MTGTYRLECALLDAGWARDVRVSVGTDGHITRIERDAFGAAGDVDGAGAQSIAGYVVPGMPNGHSHAFQRAMAGNAEFRLSARDSFWTWRQAMYALASRITADDLEVIARQLFVEMLKAGYTAVAEFHYLHRATDGSPYLGSNELWDAVTSAAESAGIGLTFLPTLYQTSDFGAQPLRPEQARFAFDTESFLRALEARVRSERAAPSPARRTGVAFHSLRAVPLESLREAVRGIEAIDARMPIHIHIAEQIKEVEACLAHCGRRPIELLLDTGLVDERWCLVHATHASPTELDSIAASRANVCVSISTEANLGDGFFDAARYLGAGGRVCVGSDSQSTVCPAEELRWMEYQARLRKRRRAVLADKGQTHVGTRLWAHAARSGAIALGQPAGIIAEGARADWLVLDAEHPAMAGADAQSVLDRLLFAGGNKAIRDVMVAGRWSVKDRRHPAEDSTAAAFRQLMTRLAA